MDNKIKEIVSKMTFEQKAHTIIGGEGCWTKDYPELGIPAIQGMDGPNGLRNDGTTVRPEGTVCIPCASHLGSTWDAEIVHFAGETVGKDCINNNEALLFGPGVNMKRTPYCGRNFEYYSEDPVHSGVLGAAFVNGLDSVGVGAVVKHYAMNNHELNRGFTNIDADERTMREYYLKVFEVLLKNSNPDMIMSAYNRVCGIWATENRYLLTDILRDEFGYEGVVIPDWGADRNIVKSLHAGMDINMSYSGKDIVKELEQGLEDGEITMNDIDRAVTNILKMVFRRADSCRDLGNIRESQHEAAQKIAAEGMILLKNDDNILPISNKKYKKIAVYGRHAEKPIISGYGSARVDVADEYIDSPIKYMKKYAEEENIELLYKPINDNQLIGAECVGSINSMERNEVDLMVIFVGDSYGTETETEYWDRETLTLTNYNNGLIRSACRVCDNVVVVINTGSAIVPLIWNKTIKGAISMWYPGEGGGKAIADILFGKTNPSGKLSETFMLRERHDMEVYSDDYRTWYKEGMFVGYRYYDQHPDEVWFPFGHGLSYTNFEYSNLKLSKNFSDKENDEFTVSFKVKNTGDMSGKETVQLYIGEIDNVVTRPLKELKAFDKVELAPNEEKTVEFTIKHSDLAYYNVCLRKWHIESGVYRISVGASTADIRLTEKYTIKYKSDYTKMLAKGQFIMA